MRCQIRAPLPPRIRRESAKLSHPSPLLGQAGKRQYNDWLDLTTKIGSTAVSSAEEMAGTIVYLCSPAGGYVNGQEIVVDGGYMAVNP